MSIKVLVADDSITIQKVIGIIFSGEEYSLTVVDNGKAAVDSARENEPDVLLIDALMPGMSGYEVVEAIRATPNLANKPILILTGSFEPFDEEKAKKCGADDFISKPFESQQIVAKVKELLELGKSRLQSAPAPAELPKFEQNIDQQEQEITFDVPPPLPPSTPSTPSTPTAPSTTSAPAQPEAPADIWGAFTPAEEPFIEQTSEPAAPVADSFEPDVFAIVSEENDAQISQANQFSAAPPPQQSTTEWLPVEENTFEFEEPVEESIRQEFSEPAYAAQEVSFGDISFAGETVSAPVFTEAPAVAEVSTPVFNHTPEPEQAFEESPVVFEEPVLPPVQPSTAATNIQQAPLSEEQLRAAIAAASKDVIERIVWEVVPDLAEAMISEAIRKIKEGV